MEADTPASLPALTGGQPQLQRAGATAMSTIPVGHQEQTRGERVQRTGGGIWCHQPTKGPGLAPMPGKQERSPLGCLQQS